MNTKPAKKIFYGWIIVAVATGIYLTITGPITSFGVFIKPMAAEFGWSRATTALGFTLFIICHGWFAFISGYLSDRFGPKRVVATGGLLMG